MRWASVFRVAFVVTVVVVFAVALLGIFLSGPIVVRAPKIEIDVFISEGRIHRDVLWLCDAYAPRDYHHPENLDRAAEWIAEEFRLAKLPVEFQDYQIAAGRFRNVIARREGTDPERGAIVIGAHYDAYPGSPGANDNASGVAVLLELARTLQPGPPRQTQYFVAFSTEEPPFFGSDEMGSHLFARKLVDEGVEVELMVALDMVGYYSDDRGSQRFPFKGLRLLYPDRGNFVAVVGDPGAGAWIARVKREMRATEAIPVYSFRSPSGWAPIDLSDHRSFRALGLPGVQVTDTAFLRYEHYHMPGDTPDRLDYSRMKSLVRALHGIMWERPTVEPPR